MIKLMLMSTMALLGLSACDKGDRVALAANRPSDPVLAAASSRHGKDASFASSAAGLQTRQCELTVDGKTYVHGPCLVYPMGKGLTLNAWSRGKPAHSHFAVVVERGPGEGTATWNANPDDDRAFDALGVVHRHGVCWLNRRVRICAQ